MLSKVGSEVARLPCIDEFDETAGTVKWTKRASSELERLNKYCNMTAGLEAELNLAARVMLRRNIDTSQGLVNGALGSNMASVYSQWILPPTGGLCPHPSTCMLICLLKFSIISHMAW